MTRCLSKTATLSLLAGLTLVAAQPAPGATLPAAPGYVITDLGSLGGGQTVPVALNVRGDVAGYSTTTAGQIHAFLLPANGSMQDLGTLGGTVSYATALNNRGDVAGYFGTAAGQSHAFAILDGQMRDLGPASGAPSKALGINDLRQVLVVSTDSQGNTSSQLWQNGQTVPLGSLGGSSTAGGALNNLGQVAGIASAADGTNHVFAFDPVTHQLTDQGDIGPKATITHINELGQASGIRVTVRGANIAFETQPGKQVDYVDDKYIDVGQSGTDAYSINNEDTTAGAGELPAAPGANAGVWTGAVPFTNLNNQALPANSGWTLLSANAINDAGVILGRAVAPDGTRIAYMLAVQLPALAAEKAKAIAQSLDPAIATLQKGADAAATAATPSVLAAALVDLQQARSFLTPPAGQTAVSGVGSSEASHLLKSTANLLSSIPGNSPLLAPADRDAAIATVTTALNGLQ